jgi:hypothetical protein
VREEHRVRAFDNRSLRDDETGEWRRLRNEGLNDVYFSPDTMKVIRPSRMQLAGYVASVDDRKRAYRGLVGRPEEKRPLGRSRRRWEDNIKMDVRELGQGNIKWIDLAQDRERCRAHVNAVMNFRFAYNALNFLTS